MKAVKGILVVLVLLLAIAVGYGYGCGGDDGSSGSDDSTVAAETDGTNATGGDSTAASDEGDSTAASDGGDSTEAGDDGDSPAAGSAGDSAPLTKKQFIKQADAICGEVPVRYGQLAQQLEKENKAKGKPKPSTAEVNLAAAVPPLPEAAAELEALRPPKGDEQDVAAIIAALEAAAAGLEAKPSSPLSGPKSPFDEFQKLTKAFGLAVCSQL